MTEKRSEAKNAKAPQAEGRTSAASMAWMDGWVALANETTAAALRGLSGFNTELLNYSKNVLSDAVNASQELSRCKTVEEILQIQGNYFQKTTDKYLVEAGKLPKLMSGALSESLKPLQKAQER
ncbi:MAG: phasin family protein [Pseudomonadota bacterium]